MTGPTSGPTSAPTSAPTVEDLGRARRAAILSAAARARSAAKIAAAEAATRALRKRGEPITFQAVAREAAVSHTFLYSNADLRRRIEHLRSQHRPPTPGPASTSSAGQNAESSTLVAALSAELARLRENHRDEVTALRAALERAHGENLDLRRQLQRLTPT
ncbi:DUF6262 family protein [Pseudonocardia halophobica]|uniref:DUF6262 family protein n=1 Tax=Pseudonocardia halophobica TaxID=29401 RepID=UPI003D89B982